MSENHGLKPVNKKIKKIISSTTEIIIRGSVISILTITASSCIRNPGVIAPPEWEQNEDKSVRLPGIVMPQNVPQENTESKPNNTENIIER